VPRSGAAQPAKCWPLPQACCVAGCVVGAYAISLGVTRVPAIHF